MPQHVPRLAQPRHTPSTCTATATAATMISANPAREQTAIAARVPADSFVATIGEDVSPLAPVDELSSCTVEVSNTVGDTCAYRCHRHREKEQNVHGIGVGGQSVNGHMATAPEHRCSHSCRGSLSSEMPMKLQMLSDGERRDGNRGTIAIGTAHRNIQRIRTVELVDGVV